MSLCLCGNFFMNPLKRIAFIINKSKPSAEDLASRLIALTEKAGAEASLYGEYPLSSGFLKEKDVCCVLGGDGTLLAVADEALREGVPVLGINQGKLGFLATFSPDNVEAQWIEILTGAYQEASRTVLLCKTADKQQALGLNDVVIKSTNTSRLINLRVSTNGQCITEYSSDGLIFATPTGSTAYNLSANGPIIHAAAHVIAMTPICPHTLSNRSIVFPDQTTIHVENIGHNTTPQIMVDGRLFSEKQDAFPLSVCVAPQTLQLIQPLDYHHFATIRNKLAWR